MVKTRQMMEEVLTKQIAEEFFSNGVDVITSGNHIWDKQEITDYINKENRLAKTR